MHKTIFPMLATFTGLCILTFGLRKIQKHSQYENLLDFVVSLLLRTFDAAISLFLYIFEYTDVMVILIGLTLMVFGILSLTLGWGWQS